jgi:hypothetical protein
MKPRRDYEKLIIVGAPRSGTNILRDVLTELPGFGTWPCDEINYIWRHGNVDFPSDEFTPEMATPTVRQYIGDRFDALARKRALDVVVEKTCANSLRVGFVDRVIPGARYVFIVRDGIDAVASAMQRWKARLDVTYLAKKARYVPISDLPYYASRYLANRVHRFVSREGRLAFWGPRLNGMEDLLSRYSLVEVCALQWRACVEASERDLAAVEDARVIRLRYEDFVRSPAEHVGRVASTLGRSVPPGFAATHLAGVSAASIGKGRGELGSEVIARLEPLIGETLKRHGYAA